MDIRTALCLAGCMYMLMPVTVWVVLRGRSGSTSLLAWCVGAGVGGFAYLLVGLRGAVPDWLSIYAAHMLLFASYPTRIGSLRIESGRSPAWRACTAAFCLSAALYLAADARSASLRTATALLIQVIFTAMLAWAAAQAWQASRLRSARMIALTYGVFSITIAILLVSTGLRGFDAILKFNPASAIAMATGFVAALYGNLGFMGIAIERAHRQELAQANALALESAQRVAAEQHAGQLRGWLDEREELLQLLAHEVRQPLNNATAALQAARSALAPTGMDPQAASQRVQRAEGVLGHIIGTLDNTLAATALLASPGRVDRRDVDVDALIALSIGDLDPSFRRRVQVDRVAGTRTATMDAGLMRLALRNLLSNAALYSPAQSAVVLRVTDSDEPLALVFEVLDRGQGVDAVLAARLFERGARGSHGVSGHGLGLYVVRRVMELHGGSVDLRPNPAGGAVFRLLLLQDVADGRDDDVQPARSSLRNT